jgi:ABC-type branched-subunit amino acid transport system ATPase component
VVSAKEAAIELSGVDFSYGRVQVLFDVDLRIETGETVALLGSNGAGKSTLLRVVSGLVQPARGDVLHHGAIITHLRAEQRARRGIVQLIGGAASFRPLTVADNLRAGAYRYGRREAADRIGRALELFPVLEERRNTRAGDLSGGQQHMLAFALALMHDPDVLIIDELSLGLAPVVVQQIVDVIRRLREQHLTMLIVEQTVEVALELADRALFMEKGQVRFSGTATELTERPDLLRAAFLGA